jgi:catechol 2,3-dioxygenase-like lactoylglutathione lyase family enzyme
LDHCGLSLTDLDAGEAFYGRAFGFEREFAFTLAPHSVRGLMMRHPTGARIELFEREGSEAGIQGRTPIEALGTRGYGHFALAAPEITPVFAAALDAGARALVEPSPSPEPGVRFAFLADLEGNLIELVERT